jgi:hypothetical protein
MFWKKTGSGDERTVIIEATYEMPRLLGPFQTEEDTKTWLEDNGFDEGPGFYVSEPNGRPGDIEEGIWWTKKKKIAAEIREMEEPIRL